MSLPPPSPDQAFCQVSALEAAMIKIPVAWCIDGISDDVHATAPSLAFLVRHNSNNDTLLVDLGTRKDWKTGLPPVLVHHIVHTLTFEIDVHNDVVDVLAKGGARPQDINQILFTHLHFDHMGDAKLFPTSRFLVGAAAQPLVEDQRYPQNPNGTVAEDALPSDGRTTYLDPSDWPALGPFPHALDLYGDGSAYVVDAGNGHMPGHLNLLARTSADGGWVYLAGDSAHDWRLITGDAKIGHHAQFGCAHGDVAATEEHLARLRTLMEKNPRVKVILAHDLPWYEQNKGGSSFWPGTIDSL